MRAETILKYNSQVPRYTSYPTAVQFTPAVGEAEYRQWLGRLDSERLSVYVHIPFCRALCWYCGCNMRVVRHAGSHRRYVDRLLKELTLVREATPARGAVGYLHFGGGTPTAIDPAELARIVAGIDRAFGFEADAVRAIEIDPRHFTADHARALAAMGINRASLGVQDLTPEVQQAINRIQSWEATASAAGWLRDAGVDEINIDLMYGLPHQTRAHVEANVEKAVTLRPERIVLFGYAHVPWMKRHQKLLPEDALPGPMARLEMADAAAAALRAAGYERIGLDHFARADTAFAAAAREGRIRRNFQGYTDDACDALIALGASAISDLGAGMAQNATDQKSYDSAIDAGRLATVRGVARDDDDRLRGEIIESLMCRHAADLAELSAGHDEDASAFAPALADLQPFVADGLVRVDGDRITVCDEGQPIVRAICAVFDRHLNRSGGAHASAV